MGSQSCGLPVCKATVFLLLCLCAAAAAAGGRYKGVLRFSPEQHSGHRGASEDLWFIQKLDHFNGADTRQWKQRYFINENFYKPGGPVFLMIGGEGPANPAWMHDGTWLTYAQRLGALCLMLEHRFYGQSRPTADLSTDSLRFLSSRQALADLAHFRTVMAKDRGLTDHKWVAFGGSYPGSLAAWFRLKYPHLVHAAVATSAPVRATVNFPEYLEVVRQSLATEDMVCPVLVMSASRSLAQLLKDPRNYDNITKDFNLCSTLTEMDTTYLLETLAGNFMDVVQYNQDNRAFEGVKGTNITTKVLCSMMRKAGDPYSHYAAVARLMLDTFSMKCLDASFSTYLRDMTNTSWDGPAAGGGRQWFYQTCTEFGFYQSTDSPHQPFTGFPLEYYVQQCADFFNVSAQQLAEAVAQTNEYYGGYNIVSSRIVFPNGSIDPWHALGITEDITHDLPAVFIYGTAHCANMYPASADDPFLLQLARDHIFQLLKLWLS